MSTRGDPTFRTLGWSFLAEIRDPPPREWVIEGLIARREVVALVAPPFSGKSFLAAHLALQSAAGASLWGRATEAGATIYAAGERADETKRRLIGAARTLFLTDAPVAVVDGVPDLSDPRSVDAFKRLIESVAEQSGDDGRPALAIIDTFATAIGALDELSARDVSRAMRAAQDIATSADLALLLLHHPARGGTDPRGSSAIEAATDAVWRIERRGETRALVVAASNVGPAGARHDFVIRDGRVVELADGSVAAPVATESAGINLRPDAEAALGILRVLLNGSKTVDLLEWRNAVLTSMEARSAAAKRKAWSRITKNLTDTGLIELGEDTVCLAQAERRVMHA